jgi:hypothetical protein
MLKCLSKAGDSVQIITPDDTSNPPKEFAGFGIQTIKGFRFPLYTQIVLSMDLCDRAVARLLSL